jgi:hypothetical protein
VPTRPKGALDGDCSAINTLIRTENTMAGGNVTSNGSGTVIDGGQQ